MRAVAGMSDGHPAVAGRAARGCSKQV